MLQNDGVAKIPTESSQEAKRTPIRPVAVQGICFLGMLDLCQPARFKNS